MARFEINGEVVYGLRDGIGVGFPERDLSEVNNKFFHEVRFDFKENQWVMRDEPDSFYGYRANIPCKDSVRGNCNFIEFYIHIEENDIRLLLRPQNFRTSSLESRTTRDLLFLWLSAFPIHIHSHIHLTDIH